MSPRRQARSSSSARYLAPVVFLTAVTIAVLLVRSGLSGDDGAAPPATVLETRERTTPPATTGEIVTPARTTAPAEAETYEIEAGDTLETIAVEFDTTVEQLLTLNPDLDPVALRIGQEIRVK